jgi:AraC-like DNA-binding protein
MDGFARTAVPPNSPQVVEALPCFLESSIYASRELRIAGAGRERCQSDYLIERDDFPCYTLEFVAGGRGKLILGGQSFQLLPGHLFLYGRRMPLTIRTDPETPMLKYFIEFFGSEPGKLFHSGILSPGEVRRVTEIDLFADLFEQLIAAGRKNHPQRRAICAAYLRLILLKTTEAISHGPQGSTQSFEHLARCRGYIEKHFAEIGNLADLSRAVHLDQSYLCRLFKHFKLPSPHRYINACRMNRAVELLLTTALPVKAVATQVGYADPLHFSRNFRRQFACSPSHFRAASVHRRPASR